MREMILTGMTCRSMMSRAGTPHDDSKEEHSVDGQNTILHGAERIKSTKSLDVTFLVDDACVSIKIQKIAGNCPIN
jgi:hypothetical protein